MGRMSKDKGARIEGEGRIMTDGFGFRDYVLARRITDSPVGDLVADLKSNRDFLNVGSLSELLTYLRRRGGCREARAAGRVVWSQYLSWRAAQRARAAQEELVT